MNRQTFKAYCGDTGVTAVNPVVRVNTNNYPFITILRGEEAENIYFSKKASALVDAGQDIKSLLKDLYLVETTNASGDIRLKLSFRGDSQYVDIDELF